MMPALIQRRAKREAQQEARHLLVSVGLGDRLHHRPGELSGESNSVWRSPGL